MTDLEKAARMALEALKQIDEAMPFPVAKFAQAALSQALSNSAEQSTQQEPDQRLVTLLCRIHRDGGHYLAEHGLDKAVADADIKVAELNAMSDTNPQASVKRPWQQIECPVCGELARAEPPRKPWVGLTDDEIGRCLDAADGSMGRLIAAIEAKLKEKNS